MTQGHDTVPRMRKKQWIGYQGEKEHIRSDPVAYGKDGNWVWNFCWYWKCLHTVQRPDCNFCWIAKYFNIT